VGFAPQAPALAAMAAALAGAFSEHAADVAAVGEGGATDAAPTPELKKSFESRKIWISLYLA
jgi:hypothetical protein